MTGSCSVLLNICTLISAFLLQVLLALLVRCYHSISHTSLWKHILAFLLI